MKTFHSPRSMTVTALLAALIVIAPGGVAAADPGPDPVDTPSSTSADRSSPTSDPASAADRRPGKPGRYTNPLLPQVPGGAVESCADPNVLRGQRPGDTDWYLYCTTDPLNDEDVDANGDPVFRKVPAMTSQNLVDWTYAGESFSTLPSWAEPDAALWAPDVVYSSTFDQYYMFVVVTDTVSAVSGVEDCASDSAIGVATSREPTGPWTFSDTPVVAPRSGGDGCNFQWTYDPDVLGDTVTDAGILYYGSYFGGVYGASLQVTAYGAVADTDGATMVAIDNKYEGANVVQRDGFYYLFLSATNCCNGALTGYSAFVGRSADPLGPFVDREGVSLVAERTGGTPFLTMNGNRWVGTGHNTVFTDANGGWWTIYHAVDQLDPFFAFQTGFTKRPAMLDAVDWVDGWPTVNGGSGPSVDRREAPAGQAGQVSRHRYRPATVQEPRRALTDYSDEFDGTALSRDWAWQRDDIAPSATVAGGTLSVPVQSGDLYVDADSAAVLLRDAPRGDYMVETKVRMDVPDGCCFNYAQVGVLAYAGDDEYVKLTETSIWNTRQTEFAKEIATAPEGWARYGNTIVGPPGDDWTYLRIAVQKLSGSERRDAGDGTHRFTAYTSQDGQAWVTGGTWTHTLGKDAQIALVAYGLQDPAVQLTAEFDYVRVSTVRERSPRD
ncbi:family 43 glycosylhydrolase [Microbacterium sp. P01]|uniref:family 43 glycosylhydrolase n=1 Tax=Microbacterium sp. P01 TaxID=3366261 RepID=UPI003671BBE5